MFKYLKTYLSILAKDKAFRTSFLVNISFLVGKLSGQWLSRGKKKIILISLTEHMGDVLAAEPISAHLRSEYPDANIIWSVNSKFVDIVRYNPNLDAVITVTCIAEWILLKKLLGGRLRIFDLHLNGRSCATYKLTNKNKGRDGITILNYLEYGNLLQVFASTAGLRNVPDLTPTFHFSPDRNDEVVFPFDYIVIHAIANDPERNWNTELWNALLARTLDAYPALHVVEIGLDPTLSSDSRRFHNLTSTYNLQQIAYIIKRCTLFIGVESGFGHFANALGANSLIMIGYYQHYKNYQVYSGRFKQGRDVTLYYHPGPLHQMKLMDLWPSVVKRLNLTQTATLMRSLFFVAPSFV